MNSRKLLATMCGGALALAACVNSPSSADFTPQASTAIGVPETLAAPPEGDEVGSTTTLVVPGGDEAVTTTVTPPEASTVDDAGSADDDPEVLDTSFVPLDLPVGTCFDDPHHDVDLVTSDDIPIVDCDGPHANEVFNNSKVEGEEFPGDASVHLQADSVCYSSFEDYVGMAYESSVYDFSWYFPTAESWSIGGTNIICFAYNADLADMSGSIKGTGR